ncbi:MAG: arginine deiminase family protein [Mycoplasma sp.]
MKSINVYSEIGKLRKVLVHKPGDELKYVTPERKDELLMSAIIEVEQARNEHDDFTSILRDNDVEVVYLVDLVKQTWLVSDEEVQKKFIEQWLDEGDVFELDIRNKIKKYLSEIASTSISRMIKKMMSGILFEEVGLESKINGDDYIELVIDPMPNLYFTRDPFSSVGNGITLHKMKYKTRQRETIFAQFIFNNHPEYKETPIFYNRDEEFTVEGGDIFIYSKDVLAIGVSERTTKEAIIKIAKNIQSNKECEFKKILVINVPHMKNLMHLDTWLTMINHTTFLYSGNIMGVLKVWEIDLTIKEIQMNEKNDKLENILSNVVGEGVNLIPIAGKNAKHLDIDIETNFDATNYLVIEPGIVVGYDRNKKTQKALEEAGIKVYSFNGNQLSLGMGSSRCMTMPLYRDDIKK